MLSFVWAEDQKQQIGLNGHLPWNLPADLHHFRDLTIGHPIIMGRKTFLSMPKILPDRQHIILSTSEQLSKKYRSDQRIRIVNSITELNNWLDRHEQEQVFAIGGTGIFAALLGRADRLERTVIKANFKADTVMPPIDYRQFELINKVECQPDEVNKYYYDFLTYQRKG